jgi:signal transduction histidine kinase/CheY-like chemotaxis protein
MATIAGWLTLLIFNIGAFAFTNTSILLLINNNFFFVSANLIGMLGAYNIEYYARRDFYLNQELDKQKEFVEDANKNLEKIVGERTVELTAAKNKAVQSDHLKSAFLANMSHEIRTPMNGILGFADLLKEPNLTGEEQQQYIEIIEKSGARMLNIINDIMNISKIEAGLVEVVLIESNINKQIDFIQTFFKPMAEAKGIHLFSKTALPAKESIILTDKEKVYGILTNLVKNAIKFTEKGSIEFGYRLVAENIHKTVVETRHAMSLPPETFLQFYVKDTGIGIAADRHKVIFERFIQEDIHDVNARQGAGLGLAIAKAYVEMLGGEIWMESEKGEGSTFYFTLPYNRISQMPNKTSPLNYLSQPVENDKSNAPTINILIAEDDETSSTYLATLVAGFNRNIIQVKSGKEAVDSCRSGSVIDLILMDIKMADMDGYEATRLIRQFDSEVIIIAQTAYALAGDREKAIKSGCNDYIEKPINRLQLTGLVNKYLSKTVG